VQQTAVNQHGYELVADGFLFFSLVREGRGSRKSFANRTTCMLCVVLTSRLLYMRTLLHRHWLVYNVNSNLETDDGSSRYLLYNNYFVYSTHATVSKHGLFEPFTFMH